MPFTFGSDPPRTSALELVYGAFEDISVAFRDVKYGELQWREVIPEASVDTAVNPGATERSYRVRDWRGQGSFRGRHDQSIPTVGRTIGKNRIPIEVAGVAAIFDREDARQVQFGYNESLLTDLPKHMRMACERHVEGLMFYGDENVGFDGWLNYPGVPVGTAAIGAGASSLWVNKTPDEIQFDINSAISTTWVNSRFVHLPDTVFIPGDQFAFISSQTINDAAGKSILEYIKMANVYTARTGQPLDIKPIRYLDEAGSGGTARLVVAEYKDSDNIMVPWPLPFQLLEPQEHGYDVNIYAEYKIGSYHMPYPASMSYTDGI